MGSNTTTNLDDRTITTDTTIQLTDYSDDLSTENWSTKIKENGEEIQKHNQLDRVEENTTVLPLCFVEVVMCPEFSMESNTSSTNSSNLDNQTRNKNISVQLTSDLFDEEEYRKRLEKRRQRNRENNRQYRKRKKAIALSTETPDLLEERDPKKIEEKRQKTREKNQRYRQKKKAIALSIKTQDQSLVCLPFSMDSNTDGSNLDNQGIKRNTSAQLTSDLYEYRKREEERKMKKRELNQRYRQREKTIAMSTEIPDLLEEESRSRIEEKRQKNREKTKRYRERIKALALSMGIDNPLNEKRRRKEEIRKNREKKEESRSRIEEKRQKNREKSKRYRERIKALALSMGIDNPLYEKRRRIEEIRKNREKKEKNRSRIEEKQQQNREKSQRYRDRLKATALRMGSPDQHFIEDSVGKVVCPQFSMESNTDSSNLDTQKIKKNTTAQLTKDLFDEEYRKKIEEGRGRGKTPEIIVKYRQKKKVIALSTEIPDVLEEKNRQKNREKCQRYRDRLKATALRMETPDQHCIEGSVGKVFCPQFSMESNTDGSNLDNQTIKKNTTALLTSDLFDEECRKRVEERREKKQEINQRYRQREKTIALSKEIPDLLEEENRSRIEEKRQKNREKTKRYRDRIKALALSMGIDNPLYERRRRRMEEIRKNRENSK